METGEQHKLRILLRIAALMVGDEDLGWLTDWAAVMAPWLGGSVARWLGGLVGRLLAWPVATRRC